MASGYGNTNRIPIPQQIKPRMIHPKNDKSKTNKEYIKLDRDKSTFKSHRDFSSEIEITFKHF